MSVMDFKKMFLSTNELLISQCHGIGTSIETRADTRIPFATNIHVPFPPTQRRRLNLREYYGMTNSPCGEVTRDLFVAFGTVSVDR